MKITKKTVIKLSVLAAVVFSSGMGVYGYAESVKEGQIKEQLQSTQLSLGESLDDLYENKLYQLETIDQIKQTLENYSSRLEAIQGKTKSLSSKNEQEIREKSKQLAEEMLVFHDLVSIYQAQNSLFEEDILTEEGLNKEVKLKEDITLEQIENVSEEIKVNSQAYQLEEETNEVLAFAETQFATKQAVDDWLSKNGKKYSEKNYQGLQKLVEQVVPQSVKKSYQSSLKSFKKGLEQKVADEKAAKEQATIKIQNASNSVAPTENQNQSAQDETSNTSGNQGSQSNHQGSSSSTTSKVNSVTAPAPDPAPRTDGFNFNGNHFDLSTFSGVGAVPQWTPYIYQWADDPSHYLVEKASNAGGAIWGIGIGDTVVINGQSYTVFNMMRHVPNNENAYGVLKSQGATVTWQTCESADPNSALAIWFAH